MRDVALGITRSRAGDEAGADEHQLVRGRKYAFERDDERDPFRASEGFGFAPEDER